MSAKARNRKFFAIIYRFTKFHLALSSCQFQQDNRIAYFGMRIFRMFFDCPVEMTALRIPGICPGDLRGYKDETFFPQKGEKNV